MGNLSLVIHISILRELVNILPEVSKHIINLKSSNSSVFIVNNISPPQVCPLYDSCGDGYELDGDF